MEEKEIKCGSSICSDIRCSRSISKNKTNHFVLIKHIEIIIEFKRTWALTLDDKTNIFCDEENLVVCTQNKDDGFYIDNE